MPSLKDLISKLNRLKFCKLYPITLKTEEDPDPSQISGGFQHFSFLAQAGRPNGGLALVMSSQEKLSFLSFIPKF